LIYKLFVNVNAESLRLESNQIKLTPHQATILIPEPITSCVFMYLSYSSIQGLDVSDLLALVSSSASESGSRLRRTSLLMRAFDFAGIGPADILGVAFSTSYRSENYIRNLVTRSTKQIKEFTFSCRSVVTAFFSSSPQYC
jgi:hypothetical protein